MSWLNYHVSLLKTNLNASKRTEEKEHVFIKLKTKNKID